MKRQLGDNRVPVTLVFQVWFILFLKMVLIHLVLKIKALMIKSFLGCCKNPLGLICVWRKGLPTSKIDLNITMRFKELSQVLAGIGILIYASQEEHILTVVKNLPTYPEVIKE